MKLITYAGSGKTSWALVNNEGVLIGKFEAGGLNPMIYDKETMSKNIARNSEMLHHAHYIKEIHFYGTGLTDKAAIEKIQLVLNEIFDQAKINIHTELLAAARVTAGNKAGIVSVLETGSNSGFYDGEKIIKSVGHFGYLLMDEASENWFGKQLLRNYFFDKMPKNLSQLFKQEFDVNEKNVVTHLYQKPQPNTYLASFSSFMKNHYKSKYIKSLLLRGFDKFITQQLSTYKNYKEIPLHFVGPIAYHFQTELKEIIRKHQLIEGKIIKNQLEELVKYH